MSKKAVLVSSFLLFVALVGGYFFLASTSPKPLVINIVQTVSTENSLPGLTGNILDKLQSDGFKGGRDYVFSYTHAPEEDQSARKLVEQAKDGSPDFIIALGNKASQFAKETSVEKNDIYYILFYPDEKRMEYISSDSLVKKVVDQKDLESIIHSILASRIRKK